MEISFKDKKLRDICESDKKAQKVLGKEITRLFQARISDIRAADNMMDLLAGSPRYVGEGLDEQLIVNLEQGWYLRMAPNHPVLPLVSELKIDWNNVKRVKILEVVSGYA